MIAKLMEKKIDFIEYTLDNGLHIILHKNNTNPIIALSILYHVGGKNDYTGKNGFAHFFEHLMFEGSLNMKRGDFFKYISYSGGISNAYTTSDETVYYEILPSNQLKLALWLESERMLHAKVDDESINTQREVIKQEKKLHIDNKPYKTAFSKIIPSLLFKQHPYRLPLIGSMKELDAATKNDYKKFYKTFYIPNNAVLSIAGDIDIINTKKLINIYFSDIPKGKDIIFRPNKGNEYIKKEIFSIFKDKNAKMPIVILSYIIPNKIHDDIYTLNIIDNILSHGESSKIYKNIINDKQLSSYAGTFLQDMEDYGIFTVYAIANKNINLEHLISELDKEINSLKNNYISNQELEKQKNILEKIFIDSNTSMLGIANNLSQYYLYYKDTNFINKIFSKYIDITQEDIKIVANKYLNKNQRVKLYNIPV